MASHKLARRKEHASPKAIGMCSLVLSKTAHADKVASLSQLATQE